MAERTIIVEPLEPFQVQPASIDLRLGRQFLRMDENTLEGLSLESEPTYVQIDKDQIIIPPHSFLLATTVEYIRLPSNVTAFVEGRSSIGRIGLFIQNAGWVVTHDQLLVKVWGYEYRDEPHYVRLYINYLRQKLETDGEQRLLHTVRGVGYVLREQP